MTALWVVPSIDREWGQACARTLGSVRRIVVPNHTNNRGVAASWNIGVRAVLNARFDFLVVCSEAMRFEPGAAEEFEALLAPPATLSFTEGWHLVGLARSTLERVGLFDEVFTPAYYEDSDYARRMDLAGLGINGGPVPVLQHSVRAAEAGVAHALTTGLVRVNLGDMRRRFRAKWGGDPYEEKFEHPYDDPALDLTFTGEHE